jgi:hypothetical protein
MVTYTVFRANGTTVVLSSFTMLTPPFTPPSDNTPTPYSFTDSTVQTNKPYTYYVSARFLDHVGPEPEFSGPSNFANVTTK